MPTTAFKTIIKLEKSYDDSTFATKWNHDITTALNKKVNGKNPTALDVLIRLTDGNNNGSYRTPGGATQIYGLVDTAVIQHKDWVVAYARCKPTREQEIAYARGLEVKSIKTEEVKNEDEFIHTENGVEIKPPPS